MKKKSEQLNLRRYLLVGLLLIIFLLIGLRPTHSDYEKWLKDRYHLTCTETYMMCSNNNGDVYAFKEQSIKDGYLLFSYTHTIYINEDRQEVINSRSIGVLKNFIEIGK